MTERCPVCFEQTTFPLTGWQSCDGCEVPLIAHRPLVKRTETGYELRLADAARTVLRVAYSSTANLPAAIEGRKS